MRRIPWFHLGWIAAPTLAYVAALWLDPSRALVLWERAAPPLSPALLLWAGLIAHASISLVIAQRMSDVLSHKQAVALLAYVFAAGVALQIAATHIVEPYPLRGIAFRQYSDFTGGYFSVGVRVDDLRAWLDRYAEEMPTYNVHAQRHPPGLALLFWLSAQVARLFPGLAQWLAPHLRPLACFELRAADLDDAHILAGLIGIVLESVAALLVPVLLFGFVRRIANARAATLAALLYPLTSGVLMWASQWNRGFGLFSIGGLWLVEVMLSAGGWRTSTSAGGGRLPFDRLKARGKLKGSLAALGLGVVLGLATLMSFGNVPIAMMTGIYALARIWMGERWAQVGWRLAQGALVLAGVGLVWLPLIAAGFDLLSAYQVAMDFHLALERDYFPFVFWHAWDIFTFAGLPLAMISLTTWRRAPALTAAWAVPLISQCVLHVARGETGRVWMYFAPVVVGLAAMWLEGQRRTLALPLVVSLLVVQTGSQVSLLRVIGYGADPITVSAPTLPERLTTTEIRFEPNGEVRLLGYVMPNTLSPGETATLHLYWQLDASTALTVPRKVFVHITDELEDRERIVNQDGRPANWTLPTTCWLPGQVIHDPHTFTVNAKATPGEYYVLIGLYDEFTGERAFVHTAQVAMANAVALPQKVRVRQ